MSALAAAATLLALLLVGCGGSPGDLLAIASSGGPANVHQEIVVRVDGTASCNRGPQREIPNSSLLDADAIARDAKSYAARAQTFPAGRLAGRTFVLRDQDGSVKWNESSAAVPAVLRRAELFVLRLGPAICGRGA